MSKDKILYKNIEISNAETLNSIPDGAKIHGDVTLKGISIEKLPSRLIINGNLRVRMASLSNLTNVTIYGNVYCESGIIHKIGKNVIVLGDIHYGSVKFKKVSKTLQLGGSLFSTKGASSKVDKKFKVNKRVL